MGIKEQLKIDEEKRRARLSSVHAAFQRLRKSDDFNTVFEHLQRLYPLTSSAFAPGQEANTHAAAVRDGEKNVIRRIIKFLYAPTPEEIEEGDVTPKPAQALSEFTTPSL